MSDDINTRITEYWKAERALIQAELDKHGVPNCDNIPLRIEWLAWRKPAPSTKEQP